MKQPRPIGVQKRSVSSNARRGAVDAIETKDNGRSNLGGRISQASMINS